MVVNVHYDKGHRREDSSLMGANRNKSYSSCPMPVPSTKIQNTTTNCLLDDNHVQAETISTKEFDVQGLLKEDLIEIDLHEEYDENIDTSANHGHYNDQDCSSEQNGPNVNIGSVHVTVNTASDLVEKLLQTVLIKTKQALQASLAAATKGVENLSVSGTEENSDDNVWTSQVLKDLKMMTDGRTNWIDGEDDLKTVYETLQSLQATLDLSIRHKRHKLSKTYMNSLRNPIDRTTATVSSSTTPYFCQSNGTYSTLFAPCEQRLNNWSVPSTMDERVGDGLFEQLDYASRYGVHRSQQVHQSYQDWNVDDDKYGTVKSSLVTPTKDSFQDIERQTKTHDFHLNDKGIDSEVLFGDKTLQSNFTDNTRLNMDRGPNYYSNTNHFPQDIIRRVSIQSHMDCIPKNETLTVTSVIYDHNGCQHVNRLCAGDKRSRMDLDECSMPRDSKGFEQAHQNENSNAHCNKKKRSYDCYKDDTVEENAVVASTSENCTETVDTCSDDDINNADSASTTSNKTDSVCSEENDDIQKTDHGLLILPNIPAKYPESWVVLLQEWNEMDLDSYISKSVERAAWPRSYQIRYSKRYRGIRMIRKLLSSKHTTGTFNDDDDVKNLFKVIFDFQSTAEQLDILRNIRKKSVSNHLIEFEKKDLTIQRRNRSQSK
jgi:hypothetical protein